MKLQHHCAPKKRQAFPVRHSKLGIGVTIYVSNLDHIKNGRTLIRPEPEVSKPIMKQVEG